MQGGATMPLPRTRMFLVLLFPVNFDFLNGRSMTEF